LGITLTQYHWAAAFADCKAFIARVNAVQGGNAQMLYPPDLGIHGNSHMFMLDKNNLQIADLILKWIDKNVGKNQVAENGQQVQSGQQGQSGQH
jgi:hypothetical protein